MPRPPTGIVLQSLLYLGSGVNHFLHQSFYVGIMPDHYSYPDTLVRISGAAEILGGIGLTIPLTRRVSAIGIAAMLVGFLDVHVFMLRHPERFPRIPIPILWGRLPLQALLIAWAWHYGQKRSVQSNA